MQNQSIRDYFILGFSILLPAILFGWLFSRIPAETANLAIDWTHWTYEGIQGFQLSYQTDRGPHHPPWTMLFVLPLGLLSPSTGWGIIIYAYLVALSVSVPFEEKFRWRSGLVLVLLLFSFLSVRTALDGNLEVLSLIGVLILLHGYRKQAPWMIVLAGLLVTAKPQSIMLLIPVTGIYMLQTWPRPKWVSVIIAGGLIVLLSMIWRGREWIETGLETHHPGWLGLGAMRSAGLPVWLVVAVVMGIVSTTVVVLLFSDTSLSRTKAGFLISTSLLLAPYASLVSLLTVLAIGVVPLFVRRPLFGLSLIALLNVPLIYRLSPALPAEPPLPFWNIALFIVWAVLGWHVRHQK